MNITPTFWRDFALCALAVVVLMLLGGVVDVTADMVLGS